MRYKVNCGRVSLCYDIKRCGNDLLLHIGGTGDHVGSISAGSGGKVFTHLFPGHKENFLTEYAAKVLSLAFSGNIVVSAGVHLETITKKEIEEILSLNEETISRIITLL